VKTYLWGRCRRWLAVMLALGMAASVHVHAHADAGPAAGADNDADRLRALLHEFMAGASRDDAAVHDRFWDEALVYTSSAGARFGKAEIMAGLQAPAGPSGVEYTAEDIDLRLHGELAVITFRLVGTEGDGTRQEYLNTGVFRLRDRQWRAITWQATRAGNTGPD
jgi:ketosteroid isomerase-like protein